MRDDRPGDLPADPCADSAPVDGPSYRRPSAASSPAGSARPPAVDETTLDLLRRLLTLPDAEVDRVRAATRPPPRDPQSGPSADYRDD